MSVNHKAAKRLAEAICNPASQSELARIWTQAGEKVAAAYLDLATQLEVMRMDAERYRWLRAEWASGNELEVFAEMDANGLDAAIDKAKDRTS